MNFINEYLKEIIATLVVILTFIGIRLTINAIITRFGKQSNFPHSRTNLVMKYIDYLITSLAIIALIGIWGVERQQAFLAISSIFTVIGVALFAQWSILSNVTAGILLFFSFPFKIGDRIRILDKEFPIEAEIIDIKSFYTLLKSSEGEEISYPNNLLLQKGIVIIPENLKNKPEETQKDYID